MDNNLNKRHRGRGMKNIFKVKSCEKATPRPESEKEKEWRFKAQRLSEERDQCTFKCFGKRS